MKKGVVFAVLISVLSSVFVFFFHIVPLLLGIDNLVFKSSEDIGTINLIVLPPNQINITHPLNITYNFSIADYAFNNNLTLDLNVSATFSASNWRYTLEEVTHGVVVNSSVMFTPNTTINVMRYSNRLTVFADDPLSNTYNASVVFFVFVNNSAPLLGALPEKMLLCEDHNGISVSDSQDSLSLFFNATDIDDNNLFLTLNPSDPFFVSEISESFTPGTPGQRLLIGQMFSGRLLKDDVGFYQENLSVDDLEFSDSAVINITVIEVNNIPVVENVGARTLYIRGENRTFYEEVDISDTEDGTRLTGNVTFNLTFLNSVMPFFNISKFGVMNFTANESYLGPGNVSKVYNLSLCVVDNALSSVNPNIGYCLTPGGKNHTGGNNTLCQNFSLTVTNDNRAPKITSYYPLNLTFGALSTSNLYFNISKKDPDGTIPDGNWYVDGTLRESDIGSSVDEFMFSFGCGVSGVHSVRAEATDGLLSDSVQWNITLEFVACPPPEPPGGGGGGIGAPFCEVKWACNNWNACQLAQPALRVGNLIGEDYRLVNSLCLENAWSGDICGFQRRTCFDINDCNRTLNMPSLVQGCYYSEFPSCFDGIKNCHLGACEVLVDCGGPCSACPTCSDGMQNQGEEAVDCGGPCPIQCPLVVPMQIQLTYYVLAIVAVILLILLGLRIYRVWKLGKEGER